jgi:hypothetical protein
LLTQQVPNIKQMLGNFRGSGSCGNGLSSHGDKERAVVEQHSVDITQLDVTWLYDKFMGGGDPPRPLPSSLLPPPPPAAAAAAAAAAAGGHNNKGGGDRQEEMNWSYHRSLHPEQEATPLSRLPARALVAARHATIANSTASATIMKGKII